MLRRVFAVAALLALTLSGCAGYGVQTVSRSEDQITLAWYKGTGLDAAAHAKARRYCAFRDKAALEGAPADTSRTFGREFLCRAQEPSAGPVIFHTGRPSTAAG
jgi:hypothetical protein